MFDTPNVVVAASGMIPPGLDGLEPGMRLAALLTTIDLDELSGHDRIIVLRAHQRMASHHQAQMYDAMAAVSDSCQELDEDPELASEAAAAEIRAALRLTRRAADGELDFALSLRRRLPGVWALLAAGAIDARRARVITESTSHLSIAGAREAVSQVIDRVPGLTTGQLRARLRRLCIVADPDHAQERYREAVSDRRVVSEPSGDGTAHLLGLDLAPHRVAVATRLINLLARGLKTRGETRSMDQLRADVLLDLLGGAKTTIGATKGTVDIHVDLETLAGLSEAPGELAGYGPVIADISRQVADQQTRAQWRFTVTDPETGQVVGNGITRRRPTADQRREVQAQHPTCIFPGCRMPATDCDLDHRTPYGEGGPTITPNLAPLCRHDHRIRTINGWTHQTQPNGDHTWITKLGHTYTTSGQPP